MPAPQQSPARVLLVDDAVQVRRELATLLALAGRIEIIGEAGDGQQAITLAQALQPDVVLLDLAMPVMDGYAAAPRLKAVCPACRVVALTLHGGEAERCRALAAGCDAFLVKGAPLQTLLDTICAGPRPAPLESEGSP
jgi:two-component system response regulator DesR